MRLKTILLASLLTMPALAAAQPTAEQPMQTTPPPPEMDMVAPPAPRVPVPGEIVYPGTVAPSRGEHRIRMEAGRRYTVTAVSDAFDTKLAIYRAGSEEAIAENDDAGGSTNAEINFTASESAEYVVRVTSFSAESGGAYQLIVAPSQPMTPLLTRVTRTERSAWRVYQGDLAATDGIDGGRRYDDYELRLTAGQTAMIYLQATGEWDPMLRVYSLSGRGSEVLQENDDAGGSLNSFIFFAPGEAGTYVVRVTSFGENVTGAYRLRISQ